jgi:hypothetical protein
MQTSSIAICNARICPTLNFEYLISYHKIVPQQFASNGSQRKQEQLRIPLCGSFLESNLNR